MVGTLFTLFTLFMLFIKSAVDFAINIGAGICTIEAKSAPGKTPGAAKISFVLN